MSHLEHLLVLGLGAHVATGQPEPVLLCPGHVLGLGLPRLHCWVLLLPWAKRGTQRGHTQLTRASPREAEWNSLKIYQQAGKFLFYSKSNVLGKLLLLGNSPGCKGDLPGWQQNQALH